MHRCFSQLWNANASGKFFGQQKMQQVTAKGDGSTITISGTAYDLANLSDVRKLIVDVQTLAGDVAEMRATLNFLIKQMRGR